MKRFLIFLAVFSFLAWGLCYGSGFNGGGGGGGITGDGNATHFPDGSGTWRGIQTTDVANILAWLGSQLSGGTIDSLSIGDGNFTVDQYGNIAYKSAASVRTDDPQYAKLYEATSKGDKYRMIRAPAAGYTSGDNETVLELPPGDPVSYQVWAHATPVDNISAGSWLSPMYWTSTSPILDDRMLLHAGGGLVRAAIAGTNYVSPFGIETLVNKTLTAPSVTKPIVLGSTTATLTAANVSSTHIYNTGQHLNNVALTLPAAASGHNFVAQVGEGQSAAAYWRFTANAANTMCLDGVCGKTYIQNVQPDAGDILRCEAAYAASTGVVTSATLSAGTDPTQVKTAAFTYDLLGKYISKAAVDGTVPGDDVIPEDLYGAVALDIADNGTISVAEATANATGYASSALALAGLPTVAAGYLRIGTVTAMKSDGAFTFGTTSFSDAAVTKAFTSTAAYTKGYVWLCESAVGTWETN